MMISVRFRGMYSVVVCKQLTFWFCLQQISKILLRCYFFTLVSQMYYIRCIISGTPKSANSEKYGLGRCLPWDTSKAMGHLVPLFNFTLTGNSRNDILALNSFLRNIQCSIESRSDIHSPANTLKNRSVWEPHFELFIQYLYKVHGLWASNSLSTSFGFANHSFSRGHTLGRGLAVNFLLMMSCLTGQEYN